MLFSQKAFCELNNQGIQSKFLYCLFVFVIYLVSLVAHVSPALQVGLDQVRETDSLSLRSRVETLETNMEKEVPIFRGLGDQQDCKAVVECEAKDGLV